MKHRHAVIDVGTNSVKLLVADLSPVLKTVAKVSRQTRLGQGLFLNKRLDPEAICRTVAAVTEFAGEARRLQVSGIRVLGTSATREGTNSHELMRAVLQATGLKLEVISGDQEAELVFRGVISDPAFAKRPILIVDVGGGSTECVVGEDGIIYSKLSAPLGTTRLLESKSLSDPPSYRDLIECRAQVTQMVRDQIKPQLQPILSLLRERDVRLVGLGGALKTITRLGLGAGFGDQGQTIWLGGQVIHEQVERLWKVPAVERRRLDGMDHDKADVVLTGALVYEVVVAELGFYEVFVSERGLRHGALLDTQWTDIPMESELHSPFAVSLSAPAVTGASMPVWSSPPQPPSMR